MALIRAQMKDDLLNHFSNNCLYQPTSSELKAKTGPSPQTTLPFQLHSPLLPLPLPAGQIHEAKVGRGRDIGIKAVKWETFIFTRLVVRLKIGSHLM